MDLIIDDSEWKMVHKVLNCQPICTFHFGALQWVTGQPSLGGPVFAPLLIRASLSLLHSGFAESHLLIVRDRKLNQHSFLLFNNLNHLRLCTFLISLLHGGGELWWDHAPSHKTGIFSEQRGHGASDGE